MTIPTPPPSPAASSPSPALDPVQAHPHPAPTPYQLILRTWAFAWWRPAVGMILVGVGAIVALPLLLMPVLALGIAIQGGNFSREFAAAANQTKVTPASMLYLNLSLAGIVLVTWLVVRYLHRLRPRWLMSVRPGIRWPFFFACAGLSVIAMIAQIIVGAVLPGDANGTDSHLARFDGTTVAFIFVVLLTTPLQAMGEEYGFRGYTQQAFGAMADALARRLGAQRQTAERIAVTAAILISAGLFALAHGVQNFPLFFDRFAFGVLAGYLVYRTGGLEAGIALHVWNNLVAFGFGIAYGQVQQQLTATSASWWNLPITITQNGVYLILVIIVAKRMGIDNRTRPPVLEEQSSPV